MINIEQKKLTSDISDMFSPEEMFLAVESRASVVNPMTLDEKYEYATRVIAEDLGVKAFFDLNKREVRIMQDDGTDIYCERTTEAMYELTQSMGVTRHEIDALAPIIKSKPSSMQAS